MVETVGTMPTCRVRWAISGTSGMGSFLGAMNPRRSDTSALPWKESSTMAVSSMRT